MKRLDDELDVALLDLDELNPRLPEDIQGSEQAEILTYLSENDVLEELMDSYLSNGYFLVEPLLVLPTLTGGRRVVVEGNRRLAALMVLLQLPPAVSAQILPPGEAAPSPEALDRLRTVPAVEVASREELSDYLGFRHISGLKVWSPEAKARWLYQQVEDARDAGSGDPFYEVGRRVGSNARGVRSAYNAYNILRYGRDVLKQEAGVDFVMKERFGVWTRLLGTANVPAYIGLSAATATYEQAKEQVEHLDAMKLAEVISDLVPAPNRTKAVLEDSRDATNYSAVIGNDRARQTLRTYGNLRLATEVAELGDISTRLTSLVSAMETITLDVARYEVTQADSLIADDVAATARTLRAAVAAAVAGDD